MVAKGNFFFFDGTGFELRASHLLGSTSLSHSANPLVVLYTKERRKDSVNANRSRIWHSIKLQFKMGDLQCV
jgi:hypothetical protein